MRPGRDASLTHAAAALSGFITGVAIAAIAGWFLRDRIRARMPREGPAIGARLERFRFGVIVCASAAALIVVAVFLVR